MVSGIQVSDADYEELGEADLTVSLAIPAGQGTLNVATGVSGGVTNITGNGMNAITLIGRIAEINATLAAATGVTYTVPNGDFNDLNNGGSVVLTVSTNDQGKTGAATGVLVSGLVPIRVNPINDDPILTAPAPTPAAAIVVDEDKLVTFLAVNNTLISVSDVDLAESADNSMDVTIVANNGTFKLFTTVGLVAPAATPRGTSCSAGVWLGLMRRWTGRSSRRTPNFNGPTTLQVTVNDLGTRAPSPAKAAGNVSRVMNLRFNAQNDTPKIMLTPVTVDDHRRRCRGPEIHAIQINDPDVKETPGGELLVTLRVSHGTLRVRDNLETLFLKPGEISGNGTGTVVLAASPAEINLTLAAAGGLIYQPIRSTSARTRCWSTATTRA